MEETPEQMIARNLDVFEKTLSDLSLPTGVTGKNAGGGRYSSVWHFFSTFMISVNGGGLGGIMDDGRGEERNSSIGVGQRGKGVQGLKHGSARPFTTPDRKSEALGEGW